MNSLLVLFIIFVILILLITKKAGLLNLFGLGINFVLIFLLITLISWGFPVLFILPILGLMILASAIFLSSDEAEITVPAFKTSLIVLAAMFILIILVQQIGYFQGFGGEDIDELENLSLAVGLDYSQIAVAVIFVSMLGAVAEAAMAIIAALSEVIEQDEQMTISQFKAQRSLISHQILGNAIDTLFFGVSGSTVGLVLWFVKLKYSWAQILNSKLLMAEVATMLLGFIAIIFSIVLAGYFVKKEFQKESE